MYQGLIIEGVSGTGKTAVLDNLLRHTFLADLPASSRLVLTEHHTQRVLEGKEQAGLLQPRDHIQLLDNIVTFLETLQARTCERGWDRKPLTDADLFFILERFHLSHVFRFSHMSWDDVLFIDERLYTVGAHLCLLTANEAALESRLFARKNACWNHYLKQYGETPTQIVESFAAHQALAIHLCTLSSLPSTVLDTSDLSTPQVTEALLHLW